MKEITMSISELSDSRELLESKPYPIVTYFIYIVLGIIAIAITWSFFGEMDIVSKGSGIVRPDNGISIINNKVTGKVVESYLEEGKQVKKGDLLYVIDHENFMITRSFS